MTERVESQQLESKRKTVLRALRERAGLTREQLVTKLNNEISLTTLARWENTGAEPSMTRKQWAAFCEAVGVPFDKLPELLSAPAEALAI